MINTQSEEEIIIYNAPRGITFKNIITSILKRGKLKQKYINKLTDEKGLEAYDRAFTAKSANFENNYETYEQIGDLSANKFIVSYVYKRFPQLNCPKGVKVVARLRINYGSRHTFSGIADNLGFWPFISASEEERNSRKKDLLEDCLEAFVGCTETILDNEFRVGVGYAIVYEILTTIFDEKEISLNFEDLYDPKTRLKEIFDISEYKKILGKWTFIDKREEDELLSESSIYQVPNGSDDKPIKKYGNSQKEFTLYPRSDWVLLGTSKAARKQDAQQKAAEVAIKVLAEAGWYKEIPEEYKIFSKK